MTMPLWPIDNQNESAATLTVRDIAMCEHKYDEAIEDASEILVDAMLGDLDELIDEGRQLDVKVRDVLRLVGARMLMRLFEILGAVLIEEARRRGLNIERRKTVEFKTLYGPVEVESAYLYDESSAEGSRPMRRHFGVVGDRYSDACERALSHFGSETSYQKAARHFAEHYGWEVGRTTIRSRTQSAADAAEAYLRQRFATARKEYDRPEAKRPTTEEVLIEADGCMIRCGQFMTAAQARRRCEQKEDYRQLERLEEHEDDELVRFMEYKEVRTGLARKLHEEDTTYICTRGTWSEVAEQLFAVGCEHELGFETQVVGIGDGANGLKESLEFSFAHFQYILDHRHLTDHLNETATLLVEQGELDGVDEFVDQIVGRLHNGEALKVIADLESRLQSMPPPDADEEDDASSAYDRLSRLIDHLTRFCHCVNYGEYAANDWPKGSGEVESAHKTVPKGRLDQPGATWKAENLDGMCALRVVRENGWWDEMWDYEQARRQAA